LAKFKYDDYIYHYLTYLNYLLFDWDDGNSHKSLIKHGIECSKVESAFYDPDILALGIQVTPLVEEKRYGVLSRASDHTILFVCFTIRDGMIRPISARAANEKERELYEKSL
jgi:uncharacterized DUF497 family protein